MMTFFTINSRDESLFYELKLTLIIKLITIRYGYF